MSRERRSRPRMATALAVALVGSCLAAGAEAGSSSKGGVARGTSHHHHTSSSQAAPRAQIPRRLLPPAGLGSAANVPPGFYQQMSVPQGQHRQHPAPVYVPYPHLVYVESPAYAREPVSFGEPRFESSYVESAPPPAPAPPQPQPQPIYVVVQPPAADARPPAPPPAAEPAPPPRPAPRPVSREPVALYFDVQPPDAEVYLDDDYLGTGAELADFDRELRFRPGVHVLEVSHPDHPPQRLVFGLNGEPLDLVIDLAADRPSRRSRIR